jgi:hypothetical protein
MLGGQDVSIVRGVVAGLGGDNNRSIQSWATVARPNQRPQPVENLAKSEKSKMKFETD